MSAFGELEPYLVLILVGFLPTEVWRMLGLRWEAGSTRNPSWWSGCARSRSPCWRA